jgi:hypothetical protein
MMHGAKSLRLVFLNGCATNELVDKFFQYGARIVIATQAPVFDSVACQFSSDFYNCLLEKNMTIGQAFDHARMDLRQSMAPKTAEPEKRNADSTEWQEKLQNFLQSDSARAIGGNSRKTNSPFQWALFHHPRSSDAQQKENEQWRAVFGRGPGGPSDQPSGEPEWSHREPCLDLVRSLAKGAIELSKLATNTSAERQAAFEIIKKNYPKAYDWANDETQEIVEQLNALLLQPMVAPFSDLTNLAIDGDAAKRCLDLLKTQLALYTTYIKTATIIMLSDFMESIMLVKQNGDIELKTLISRSLKEGHSNLVSSFKKILEGETTLTNIEFIIHLMRDIVSFLKETRSNAPEKYKGVFDQFIKEYNGNADGTALDKALMDSIHEEMTAVLKAYENGQFDQMNNDVIRGYCDRVETALIHLFEYHRYILMYEIISVGKVEANRRRDLSVRVMAHDVYIKGRRLKRDYEFKERIDVDFTENYSVLLVSHRGELLNYLSLSPFLINVASFIEEDKTVLFHFEGKDASKLSYSDFTEFQDNPPSTLQIETETEEESISDYENAGFLTASPDIETKLKAKTAAQRVFARERFDRVREQYKRLETQFLSFIN